jgi:type IV pilus assembly protein PilW
MVTAYNGSTKAATVAWSTVPDMTTVFSFEYLLGTTSFPLMQRNCTTAAEKRRFISNIYFVSNQAHPDFSGQVIPTLMRSQFDYSSTLGLVQTAPVPVIEGVEQFRVELGIDDTMSRCSPAVAVVNTAARSNVKPSTCAVSTVANENTLPTNRGDGAPDRYKRCTTAAPCTAAELTNVVSVKLYMLVRSRDVSRGYVDNKTYCLGQANTDGTCPAASQVAAANDAYKRHVFVSTVRLMNVSGRRETP